VTTPEDLSKLLSIEEEALWEFTVKSIASPGIHYDHFDVPKRRGGKRRISFPTTTLQDALRRLNSRLLCKAEVDWAAFAFGTECSTLANATEHAGKALLIKLDLMDFFGSIRFPTVKLQFQKLGYSDSIASLMALLTTANVSKDGHYLGDSTVDDRCLPQGAATSPYLSNIVCRNLDYRLGKAARAAGFVYTRYADDLTFSNSFEQCDVESLMTAADLIIADEGFRLNAKKTRLVPRTQRQIVTGLVVNDTEPASPAMNCVAFVPSYTVTRETLNPRHRLSAPRKR